MCSAEYEFSVRIQFLLFNLYHRYVGYVLC